MRKIHECGFNWVYSLFIISKYIILSILYFVILFIIKIDIDLTSMGAKSTILCNIQYRSIVYFTLDLACEEVR